MTASTLTLTTARTRLQNALVDTGALSWSADTLDEGIRQAVSDVGISLGAAVTLSGLDSAAATTIDARDDDIMLKGAAAYVAMSRAADRADVVSIEGGDGGLRVWAAAALVDYQQGLERIRRRGVAASTAAPAGTWDWDESADNW